MAKRFRRVNTQSEPDTPGTGPLSRTIPTLQRLCGEKYPEPLRYGQPLSATPRNVGRWVRLGSMAGAQEARIVQSSTPPRPTLAQLSRGARSLCDRGYIVETRGGVKLAVNAKQVREANRSPREGLCPFHRVMDGLSLGALVHAVEEERRARGTNPRDEEMVRDLPFPHRRGSSACCEASEVSPERVLALLAAWETGEGADEMVAEDFVELARRATPRGAAWKPPRSLAEVRAAMRAVQDYCWTFWQRAAERASESRVEVFKRVKADVRRAYAGPARAKGSRKGRAA